MRIIFVILFLISLQSYGQIINASRPYRPFTVASCSYLLDQYSGAAAAYSLRQLDCDYVGSAIRVRRSSDNTEQDIGFVNGNLDTASLKTFVGTGGSDDGFVVTWYDQSGNSLNVTQSTSGKQPLIIDNGVIDRQATKPSIKFVQSSGTYLDGGDVLDLSEYYFNSYCVAKFGSSANGTVYAKSRADGSAGRYSILKEASTIYSLFSDFLSQSRNASVSYSNTDYSLFQVYINKLSDTNQLKKNNTQIAVNTSSISDDASNTTNKFYIGAYQDATGLAPLSGYYLDGYIGELIIYRSFWNETQRNAIISNINSYYSIY